MDGNVVGREGKAVGITGNGGSAALGMAGIGASVGLGRAGRVGIAGRGGRAAGLGSGGSVCRSCRAAELVFIVERATMMRQDRR